MALVPVIIIKMPIELRRKLSKIKRQRVIFPMDKRGTPSSSGRGEAIIIAPMTGVSHKKYLLLKIWAIGEWLKRSIIGSNSLKTVSLKKLKMIKSPITDPSPAQSDNSMGLSLSER